MKRLAGCIEFSVIADNTHEYEYGNLERQISVSYDNIRWSFKTVGDPLPYEEVEHYHARRIRDRFTVDMLLSYCSVYGVRPFDRSFYRNHSVLFHDYTLMPPNYPSMTLPEAQREFGLSVPSLIDWEQREQ